MSLELTKTEHDRLKHHRANAERRAKAHPFAYSERFEMKIIKLVDDGLSNAEIHRQTGMSIDRINETKKKFQRWGK